MNSRDKILANLRAQERELPHPPAWRSRRNFDDLVARFTEALTSVKGEVFYAESLTAATDRLSEQIEALNARKIVYNNEAPLIELGLAQRWPQLDWHQVGQNEDALRQFCVEADLGLSSATVALAETGSIVLTTGPGRSRLATLLPTVHLAMIPTSRLVSDIFTWTGRREAAFPVAGQPPSNLVFVSGPSKSADIGQTLAVGVHGPKRFMVILYEDTVDEG